MPLKARLDDDVILSFSLPDQVCWNDLKDASREGRLTMSCCGVPAIPKTMHGHGTRFFAHKVRHDCEWGGESAEHEMFKIAAAKAAISVGWIAETEVSGPDWRADVLARKDGTRIAVEIQLSPQTAPETHRRTDRYENDGVQVIWLFKRLPPGLRIGKEMPAFQVESEYQVDLLVRRFLTGDLVWNDAIIQAVPSTLVGYDLMCECCGTIWHNTPFYVRKKFKQDRQSGSWFVGKTDELLSRFTPEILQSSRSAPLKRRFGLHLQYCPTCNTKPPEHSLSMTNALSWPYMHIDFMDKVARSAGWGFPRRMPKQFEPTCRAHDWKRIIRDKGLEIDPDDILIWSDTKRKAWINAEESKWKRGKKLLNRQRLDEMVVEMNRQLEQAAKRMEENMEFEWLQKKENFLRDL